MYNAEYQVIFRGNGGMDGTNGSRKGGGGGQERLLFREVQRRWHRKAGHRRAKSSMAIPSYGGLHLLLLGQLH